MKPEEVPRGCEVINGNDSWIVYKFNNQYYLKFTGINHISYVFEREGWESFVKMIAHSGMMTGVHF